MPVALVARARVVRDRAQDLRVLRPAKPTRSALDNDSTYQAALRVRHDPHLGTGRPSPRLGRAACPNEAALRAWQDQLVNDDSAGVGKSLGRSMLADIGEPCSFGGSSRGDIVGMCLEHNSRDLESDKPLDHHAERVAEGATPAFGGAQPIGDLRDVLVDRDRKVPDELTSEAIGDREAINAWDVLG